MALTKQFRLLDGSGGPVTGQTANLAFRISPYGAGQVIGGLTFNEIGTQGNYVCTGIDSYYQDVKLYLSGAEQTAFGIQDIGDPDGRYLALSGGTMTGTVAMSSKKITGLAEGTTAGDVVRYEQVVRNTGTQTISGVKSFEDNIPQMIWSVSPIAPSTSYQLVWKKYVDDLFSAVAGTIQSTHTIKCLVTRTIEDQYSRPTLEKCVAYLSGLGVSTNRGNIILEPSGLANKAIAVSSGAWNGDGIDIIGIGKPRITLNGFNGSRTADSKIVNCLIYDFNVIAARDWTNYTFEDCDFIVDTANYTFTNCKFLDVRFKSTNSGTLTMSNCKGTSFLYNDTLTPTITGTQPAEVKAVDVNNLGL